MSIFEAVFQKSVAAKLNKYFRPKMGNPVNLLDFD